MQKIKKEHEEIIDNINVFKEKLQSNDDNSHKGEGEYKQENIAELLREKEEGIQELEMKK